MNWTEGLINAIDYIETHLIDGEWICFDCSDTTPANLLRQGLTIADRS